MSRWFIIGFLAICGAGGNALAGDSMHKIRSTDIIRVEAASNKRDTYVTLRVHNSVPLKYWVNCDYYDHSSQIIASTNHVLLERVPTWRVKAKANNIYFALCYVPGGN
ncbi:hypothetical protein [Marinobacter halophilus]|uniref:Uncharacterized protein n=1 Tax=Marinobacter halophilus TaxID=1323740 RepID=A0A2T1K8Q6_9GAMM|nr:hypothetical protein [Marinobacter halophilus]PSF06516.1 hypothetical protein C7H08_15555 [Marinobacter halophilus]GGC73291.1 hypothetical protein GCM10011362_22250 [Marinobacter halophilus]